VNCSGDCTLAELHWRCLWVLFFNWQIRRTSLSPARNNGVAFPPGNLNAAPLRNAFNAHYEVTRIGAGGNVNTFSRPTPQSAPKPTALLISLSTRFSQLFLGATHFL
jgi:hypothetical protein